MLPQETSSSEAPNEEQKEQPGEQAVDLEALAREILALLKQELRIENERQGRA